jgi:hypothetical protein
MMLKVTLFDGLSWGSLNSFLEGKRSAKRVTKLDHSSRTF